MCYEVTLVWDARFFCHHVTAHVTVTYIVVVVSIVEFMTT